MCASPDATMHRDDRIKKRMLSGASSEKLAPRPGTTSTVQRVCAQRLNCSRNEAAGHLKIAMRGQLKPPTLHAAPLHP